MLLRNRPKIDLRLPSRIVPGRTFDALILLNARRQVPIRYLDVFLVGTERRFFSKVDSQSGLKNEFLRLKGRLSEATVLPQGRTELRCRFSLPDNAPPSYSGLVCHTEYEITAHASIPWWPDARTRFLVTVSPPVPGEPPPGNPRRFSTAPAGPHAREPYLEGSLASDAITPGGSLHGAVALGNVAYNRFLGLSIGIVAFEQLQFGGVLLDQRETRRYQARLSIAEAREGQAFPFQFRIPEAVIPSFVSHSFQLRWYFEIKAEIRWSNDIVIRVPIRISPASRTQSPTRLRSALPSVGEARLRELWQSVGNQLGYAWEDRGVLQKRVQKTTLEVRREHRGSAGLFLVADLAYPSLRLGLMIRPRHGLGRLLSPGVSLGEPEWDKKYLIKGREAAQIKAFGKRVVGALSMFDAVSLDDEKARVEWRNAGQQEQALRAFLQAVDHLALVLEEARSRVPPPAIFALSLSRWRDLAARLAAPLDTSCMAISGTYDGMPVEILTEWSREGEAVATWVSLSPSVPIDSRFAFEWSSLSQTKLGENSALPGEAREVLAELEPDARLFHLSSDALVLGLPAPCLDPLPLLERIGDMARLCVFLRAGFGPYR